MDDTLLVQLIGGLEVRRLGARVELGGPKQRAVLALLALSVGRPIPVGRLIELVWGDDAPSSARQTLQSYVSNLRRALAPAGGPGRSRIGLDDAGYRLLLPEDAIDVPRIEQELRSALATGAEADLAARPRPARLLPELAEHPCVVATQRRLDALHEAALTAELSARVGSGGHLGALADLRVAVDEHPGNEELWACFAVALYRSGRQAEALGAVHEARSCLAEASGLEPGPRLRAVEDQILAQSSALDVTSPPVDRRPDPKTAPRCRRSHRADRGRRPCPSVSR